MRSARLVRHVVAWLGCIAFGAATAFPQAAPATCQSGVSQLVPAQQVPDLIVDKDSSTASAVI